MAAQSNLKLHKSLIKVSKTLRMTAVSSSFVYAWGKKYYTMRQKERNCFQLTH